MNFTCRAISCIVLSMTLGGCQQPLPTFARMNAEESAELIRRRFDSINALSAGCTISLRSETGESVHFEGALAARPPRWLRLRAWKFNAAVFDVTVTPDGQWLFVSDDASRRSDAHAVDVTAAQIAGAWALIHGGFFDAPLEEMGSSDARALRYAARLGNGIRIICTVDRETLTPRRYAAVDEQDESAFFVDLENYQLVNDLPWAHRLILNSENRRILIECTDVVINGELGERAFDPPRRAVKQP